MDEHDEHEGMGGSYEMIDGKRRLVERTQPRPEQDGANTAPADTAQANEPRKPKKG